MLAEAFCRRRTIPQRSSRPVPCLLNRALRLPPCKAGGCPPGFVRHAIRGCTGRTTRRSPPTLTTWYVTATTVERCPYQVAPSGRYLAVPRRVRGSCEGTGQL